MMKNTLAGLIGLAAMAGATTVEAREVTIWVHSPALEGNLEGNSATREVRVYLPPSYDSDPDRRYPVVYYLHGYTGTAQRQMELMDAEAGIAGFETDNEMIVVLPDALTKRGGSFYVNSPTVGDFEHFIAEDLVSAIDVQFRTIADRDSRGLAGHSMGGYGAWHVGMQHPDVFSSLYLQSACCILPREVDAERDAAMETLDPDALEPGNFMARTYYTYAAALSPNPQNPPYYWDLATQGGELDELVVARWTAQSPIVFVGEHIPALKSMEAIAMDVGDEDGGLDAQRQMAAQLDKFGVPYSFEVYAGDHTNRLTERFEQNVLPFFAEHLDAESD